MLMRLKVVHYRILSQLVIWWYLIFR